MKVDKNLLKNRFKQIVLGTSVFVFSTMLSTGNVKAVLQSNGNTNATYDVGNWMTKIRQMESLGGAMGFSETLNSNLTSSSGSNNIDVHMQKNTEYGALAILSASSYGNPNKVESGQTTTGNVTGVVMKLNKEWVVAVTNNTWISPANVAAARYKNVYQPKVYTAKVGDGIQGVVGWHGSGASTWITGWGDDYLERNAVVRSYSGSIFSYYAYGYDNGGLENLNHWGDGYSGKSWASRAVVVMGEGF